MTRLFLSLLLIAFPAVAWGQSQTLQGTLNGAAYTIKVPEAWNGTLLVYTHGYRNDDGTAYPAPNPADGMADMEPYLLARGYAVAGSGFRAQGYNIEEGVEDTEALMRFFRHEVGRPARAILFGFSGGAVINNAILEGGGHHLFDGAVSGCGIMAGTALFFDRALALGVAYDAAFGWPAAWGTPGVVADTLDFETQVAPVFAPKLFNPANFGRFEFIRLVIGLPGEEFYSGSSLLFAHMFFTTEARAQAQRKMGGPGAQNRDHTYRLSSADRAYLTGLGVDPQPMLDAMNAQRGYAGDRDARRYMNRFGGFSGRLKKPVLSIHAVHDGLATVDNEHVYARLTREARRDDALVQVYTDGSGHCDYTPEQMLTSVQAMESWVDTGRRPHASSFPTAQGFVHGFEPPAWWQPVPHRHDHDHE